MSDPSSEEQIRPDRQPLRASTRVTRGNASIGEALPADFALLDLATGSYFSLGEVGGFIWDRLDGEATLAEIASAITRTFAVSTEQASADLLRFVAALRARGLVRVLTAERPG